VKQCKLFYIGRKILDKPKESDYEKKQGSINSKYKIKDE